jgi:hypothetical protein
MFFLFSNLKYYLLARTLLQFNGDALNQSRTDLGRNRKASRKKMSTSCLLNDLETDRKTKQKEKV